MKHDETNTRAKPNGKRVVTNSGLDIGHVVDAYFELDGTIVGLLVETEHTTKEIQEHIGKDGLMNVPFQDIKAVGRYVVVGFPFTKNY